MIACRYHPDRPGVGLCVRCRSFICAACSTQLEGINYCFVCLKALAERPTRTPATRSPLWASGVVLVVTWAAIVALLWLVRGNLGL
jgi:hypothetical protein